MLKRVGDLDETFPVQPNHYTSHQMIISNKKDEIYYHFIALHAKGTQDQEVVIRRHCSRQSVLHDALALALANTKIT